MRRYLHKSLRWRYICFYFENFENGTLSRIKQNPFNICRLWRVKIWLWDTLTLNQLALWSYEALWSEGPKYESFWNFLSPGLWVLDINGGNQEFLNGSKVRQMFHVKVIWMFDMIHWDKISWLNEKTLHSHPLVRLCVFFKHLFSFFKIVLLRVCSNVLLLVFFNTL